MQITHNNLPEAVALIFQQQEEIKSLISDLLADNKDKLYSPEETRKLFQPTISRGTLNNWSKAGYLKAYSIGQKVFYKYSDIIEAGQQLKKYKKPKLAA